MKTEANDRIYPMGVLDRGLTKREYFAAMVMQGFTAYGGKINGYDKDNHSIAKASVLLADELIRQLNR